MAKGPWVKQMEDCPNLVLPTGQKIIKKLLRQKLRLERPRGTWRQLERTFQSYFLSHYGFVGVLRRQSIGSCLTNMNKVFLNLDGWLRPKAAWNWNQPMKIELIPHDFYFKIDLNSSDKFVS